LTSLDVSKALRNFESIRSEIDDMLNLGYEEGTRRKSELEVKIRTNLRLSFDDAEAKWAEYNNYVYPRFFPSTINGNDPQERYVTFMESAKRKIDSYIQELEVVKSFTAEESDDIITMIRHAAEGESVTVEFKEVFPSNAKELSDNISSFCSSNQGYRPVSLRSQKIPLVILGILIALTLNCLDDSENGFFVVHFIRYLAN
jgi:hypothetical protein